MLSYFLKKAKSNLDDKTFIKMVKQIYNNKCLCKIKIIDKSYYYQNKY